MHVTPGWREADGGRYHRVMEPFTIDPRLRAECHRPGRLRLSHLLLQRNASVPWLILVPQTEASELHRMAPDERRLLAEEGDGVARFIASRFEIDKINVAAIGNIVPQLHYHVVGRRQDDPCWPGVVWGNLPPGRGWEASELEEIGRTLQAELGMARTLVGDDLSWRTVDDVVMGGRSASAVGPAGDGLLRFSGTISLDGGGFSSARCDFPRPQDHSRAAAIGLLVRGDGRRYRLVLRCGAEPERGIWQAPFDTDTGRWQRITLPLSAFTFSRHGRPEEPAAPFDPATIHGVGLLVADRQEGAFAIEIESVVSLPASALP